MFKSLPEAIAAVNDGAVVCWKNDSYRLLPDLFGTWNVAFRPWKENNVCSLYHTDGIGSEYDPADFYIRS